MKQFALRLTNPFFAPQIAKTLSFVYADISMPRYSHAKSDSVLRYIECKEIGTMKSLKSPTSITKRGCIAASVTVHLRSWRCRSSYVKSLRRTEEGSPQKENLAGSHQAIDEGLTKRLD